jgi:colanic acid biosynthesis glycosyl transferase WcaI
VQAVTSRWANPQVVVFVSLALVSTALGMLRARLLGPDLPILTWIQDFYTLGVLETGAGEEVGVVAQVMRCVEAAG